MTVRNAVEAEADAKVEISLLCQGMMANGSPYWAYVAIVPTRVKAFVKAYKQGTLRLEDHGRIIAWGAGTEVPPEEKQRMEQEFGMSHTLHDGLLEAVQMLRRDKRLPKRKP